MSKESPALFNAAPDLGVCSRFQASKIGVKLIRMLSISQMHRRQGQLSGGPEHSDSESAFKIQSGDHTMGPICVSGARSIITIVVTINRAIYYVLVKQCCLYMDIFGGIVAT